MKKLLTIILCIAIIFTFTTGCGQNSDPVDEPADQQTDVQEEVQEPEQPETPEVPEETVEPEYKFTFDPKAVSGYWKEIFGESMVDTWYNVVDAALNGEDTFECPDEDTLGWVIGQFPEKCFPVLGELIAADYGSAHDGTARLLYLTSREEFDEKVAEFTAQVEEILNETMKEEYTDMEKALSLISGVLSFRVGFVVIPLRWDEEGFPILPFPQKSEKLRNNLRGCDQAVLFAATIGSGIDRLIRRYEKADPKLGLLLQGIGAERVESLCDAFNLDVTEMSETEGGSTRLRYSPGYGDLSIEVQKAFLPLLDAERRLGITLSDSCLMAPSKSVTAIIGICNSKE